MNDPPKMVHRSTNGIDLTVYKGEALGIIGGNGAGKSTLLKLLSQVTAPSEGKIELYGRIASMLEVGTGFNGEMTGRENVYMNGAILGMTKSEIDAKMEDIIEFSEVRDFIDTPVKRYSSGMYVKLAFSVAAHLDSEIMIMDEVLAVGDMAFQKKCLDKMRDAAKSDGRTVLYVSHNMNTIRQLCDRCAVLDKGKIIYTGEIEKAIEIYLSNVVSNDIRKYYQDNEKPDWLEKQKIKMDMVEYVNKEDIRFDTDEMIGLHFLWHNIEDVENVGLRIEVSTMDGIPQGTFVLFDMYSGKAGESSDLKIELDASMIMDSVYQFIFTFFYKDEFGNNQDIECVGGLCFEKISLNVENKWIWRPNKWGYIQLPRPTIISLS